MATVDSIYEWNIKTNNNYNKYTLELSPTDDSVAISYSPQNSTTVLKADDIKSVSIQIDHWTIYQSSLDQDQTIPINGTHQKNPGSLCFLTDNLIFGFIDNVNSNGVQLGGAQLNDFTGQHRCTTNTFAYSTDKVGYIVSTGDNYKHINSKYTNKIKNIKINESLPYVNITSKQKDKKVFGVISDGEDINDSTRSYQQGVWGSVFPKNKDDNRIYINSVGEGAIWVSDFNGPLESGDYITSSDIPGIGQKQECDMLMNYTVAKITMDCDFNPKIESVMIWNDESEKYENSPEEPIPEYDMKYIKLDGTIITEEQYHTLKQDNNVYRMAFVGCTYHCG